MTKAYEETIKEIASFIRDQLKPIEEVHSLSFGIDISGRVHDGSLKIQFRLGTPYDTGGEVKGGSVEEVLIEYMRRFGWDRRNQPLELTFVPKDEVL